MRTYKFEYSDGSVVYHEFADFSQAMDFAMNEGDHLLDWDYAPEDEIPVVDRAPQNCTCASCRAKAEKGEGVPEKEEEKKSPVVTLRKALLELGKERKQSYFSSLVVELEKQGWSADEVTSLLDGPVLAEHGGSAVLNADFNWKETEEGYDFWDELDDALWDKYRGWTLREALHDIGAADAVTEILDDPSISANLSPKYEDRDDLLNTPPIAEEGYCILFGAFIWTDTRKGYEYWAALNAKLLANKARYLAEGNSAVAQEEM